jgi:hypothetical protein
MAKRKASTSGGTKRQKVTSTAGQHKVHKVMKEYKSGSLHSGSGARVTSRKQAVAIALSEGRRA